MALENFDDIGVESYILHVSPPCRKNKTPWMEGLWGNNSLNVSKGRLSGGAL